MFYPIYIKLSLFCLKHFNLSNLDRISHLINEMPRLSTTTTTTTTTNVENGYIYVPNTGMIFATQLMQRA